MTSAPTDRAVPAVSRETWFLLAVCMADALSSAWLFHHRLAVEANPLLLPYAEAGAMPFLAAKSLTFLPALALCEWYRRRRPQFVLPLLRWTGVAYVAIYSALVIRQFLG